jgi:hypothetical protein
MDPDDDLPPFKVTGYNQIETVIADDSGKLT